MKAADGSDCEKPGAIVDSLLRMTELVESIEENTVEFEERLDVPGAPLPFDVALGTELTATTEEGDADVGTDDVAGMGNDDDVPGDEGAEDVELAPTAPPEP